ncbi:DUF6441 family protein [Sphingorhabdus sp. 109]|uniref:DUF6441 family protein n=1 Tax=Sphingorhabdus sp. 109 TaxID=2653173 RepID=UPI0012EF2A99|nr:DUF6441 family protein [Sphingorhabdus sp. 109]VWX56720.1 conserved hypothetical protein [Sphingorhabdus sp. 109]
MSSKAEIEIEIDERQLTEVEREVVSFVLKSGVRAVKATTRGLEREFEALTRAKVKGKAWRAWKSTAFPKADIGAYDPVGTVFINGGNRSRGMVLYFTTPGINRAKRGEYLAVPLGAAVNTAKGRDISPRQWEGRNGVKLRPLFRPGETPLLVADGAVTSTGAFQAMDPGRLRAKQRGGQNLKRATVPIFALLTDQDHANSVSLYPAIVRGRADLVTNFRRRIGARNNED